MNKTIIMTLAAALMVPAMANEDQPQVPAQAPVCKQQPGRPGRHLNPERHKEMLEKFDADKDGKLSDEERKAAREAMKDAHGQRGDKAPRGPRAGKHGRPGAPAPEGTPAPAPAPEVAPAPADSVAE